MPEDLIMVETGSRTTGGTDLSDLARILRRRWIHGSAVAVVVSGAIAFSNITKTPIYQSETLILVDNKTAVPIVPNLTSPEVSTSKDLSTEIQILQSHSLVAKAISKLPEPYSNLSVGEVAGNLSIRQAGQADVLSVSYQDTDPSRIKAVLDALGNTYVDFSLERQRSQATNAVKFIQEQLPIAQQALNESTLAVQNFRQRYGILDPDSYAGQISALQQDLQRQAQIAEVSLNQTRSRYEELSRQIGAAGYNPKTALPNTILSQDDVYQKLAGQLKEIDAKYTIESSRFLDSHPILEDLRTKRSNLLVQMQERSQTILGNQASQVDNREVSGFGSVQQDLTKELLKTRTEIVAQTSQLAKLLNSQVDLAKDFQKIPQLQQSYTELQRQLSVRSQSVNRFLEKLQDLQITEAQETAPWKIIEPPYVPKTPISPNVNRSLVMALLAGLFSGAGAAVLLERFDQRLKRVEEAKEITGLPTLAVVPKVTKQILSSNQEQNYAGKSYNLSPLTDALQSLALNLRYLSANGQVKTLAFTSATPGEGKTTLTYYLAVVLSELGYRVLLVDADMRKPSVHKMCHLINGSGLSTAIATGQPWRQLLHSNSSGNLDVITSGPLPPNPVALLQSETMTQHLNEWRKIYDYVLLDTTPIAIADAQSVVFNVDATILVAAMEHSTRSALGRAVEVLRASQCNLAGLVINQVHKTHGESYYFSSYASYYKEADLNGNKTHLHR